MKIERTKKEVKMIDTFNISRIAQALERIADKMDDLDLALSTINETLEDIKK